MQFKGLGIPSKHFATQKCFCIDENIACGCYETSQHAFQNLKIILQSGPSVFKFNLKWTVIFLHKNFRICNRRKQQRVILYFNPLYDNYPEGYDCSVKVLSIKEILTKPIEELTAENEEEFGNDPVDIFEDNMWISGGYLNIIFNQNMPSKVKHLVSLVKNTTITPDQDGYIHLEYRYNTYADTTGYWRNGAVSFNLNSLEITSETKGIKVKINSAKNGEKEVTFDLKETPSPVGLSQMDFSQMEIK